MTAAETLRAAASLMRERAEAATPGPWLVVGDDARDYYNPSVSTSGSIHDLGEGEWNAECGPASIKGNEDAAHIASWHPAVALAVADWLEESADHLDAHDDAPDFPRDAVCPTALEGLECSVLGQALKVANAYLGGEQR